MSTNAQSAKKWVEENQPDTKTLENFIVKLEQRLEKMDPEDPNWDGNEQALEYLQSLVFDQSQNETLDTNSVNLSQMPSANEQNLDTSSLHDAQNFTPDWDATSLTPNVEVKQELPNDQKRALFEQLKKQVQS